MSMTKICIVTWYGSGNHGTSLQSFALSDYLKRQGYDVYFLRSFNRRSFILRHPALLYARICYHFNRKQEKAFFTPNSYVLSENRKQRIADFKLKNYKEISFQSKDAWNKAIKENMIFIAGSDIIWNPAIGYPAGNFLDFAYYAKLPRLSYASSVGALELPGKYYRAYRKYLGSMAAVSVREQSVADMLQPIIHREVVKVVDPTMLLTREEWEKFADKAEVSVNVDPNGYILCYFVMNDPRYWDYVKLISEKTHQQIIVIPMHQQDEEQPYDIVLDCTAHEFVWLVEHAQFICTDSFHACVFSFIFKKEFYLLRRDRKAEDAKFDELLNRYGLTDRTIIDQSRFERNTEINYEPAYEQLEKDRKESMNFLKQALRKCER